MLRLFIVDFIAICGILIVTLDEFKRLLHEEQVLSLRLIGCLRAVRQVAVPLQVYARRSSAVLLDVALWEQILLSCIP